MGDEPLFSSLDMAELECREFSLKDDQARGFAVHAGGSLKAYYNRCPHTGISLNWQENRFLSADKSHIQCSMHGALFRIDNGLCVAGPCLRESLEPVHIRVENNRVFLKQSNRTKD